MGFSLPHGSPRHMEASAPLTPTSFEGFVRFFVSSLQKPHIFQAPSVLPIQHKHTDFLPLPSQSTFAPFLGVILAVLQATSFLACRALSRSHYSAALTGSVLHLEKQLTS